MAGPRPRDADGTGVPSEPNRALVHLSHEVRTALAVILGHAELIERADSSDDLVDSANQILSEGRQLLSILDAVDRDGTVGASVRHVLHIEDDPANLRLVRRLMTQHPGVEMCSASGVAEGIAQARALRPDLILLDLHLGDGRGEQVLEALESDVGLRDTPVVITSGDPAPEGITHRHPMVCGHLTKPMDLDEFERLVRRHLHLPSPTDHPGDGPAAPG